MKQNKFLLEHALHLATACAVLALILFIPASVSQNRGIGIFFYIVSAVMLVGGGVVLYLAYRAKAGYANYFLYEKETGECLPFSELNAKRVRDGVDGYLAPYAQDTVSLWGEIPKELRVKLTREPAFLPLIAYRMLLAICECEGEAPIMFLGADDRAVGYVCRAIRDNGDENMADYVYELKKSGDRARISAFFGKNRRIFEERMLRYVKRHENAFIVERKTANHR